MKKRPQLLLIGAGGHAVACIGVVEAENRFQIAGLVGRKEEVGRRILGYPVLGTDEDLPGLVRKTPHVLIAIGQIKNAQPRILAHTRASRAGATFPVICSPHAQVSPHAVLQGGTVVMHGAIVQPGARIGKSCILNSLCLIEHDAVVGDHCHISTGAILNGGTVVGRNSFVGSGTILREGIRLKAGAVIPMGRVVRRSTDS